MYVQYALTDCVHVQVLYMKHYSNVSRMISGSFYIHGPTEYYWHGPIIRPNLHTELTNYKVQTILISMYVKMSENPSYR